MPSKVYARFSVSYMQVLDEDGKVDSKLEPSVSDDELLKLYRVMLTSRRLDERMLKLQRQGRLGTLPVCVGQEAVSAAAALAMAEDDWFVGAYRELAGRVMRGEALVKPMMVYNGMEEGNMTEGMKNVTPVAIILASQIPHAVGIAYAIKIRGEKNAVVSFNGDGSTSEGDWHEALNFAATWQTPNVFVVQNNHWAISTPLSKQMHNRSIAQRGIAYDMESIQVDGNDPLAVYKATKEALDRAKKGEGPTLIEALTYRMLMHTTADDPKKYRKEDEVEEWVKRDPITRFRTYLGNKKLWNAKKDEALEAEIKGEIDAAVKEFESISKVRMDEPFDYIFGEKEEIIEEQRQEFLDDLRKDKEDA
ncbi:pyruvate dehydrogenase (acetyl-transferring) E1 component subunit alpha [bacterium]|nr:pyruvate dehydrogenase (acetyl-transferring) E1 component subunit alpha [bacterium]